MNSLISWGSKMDSISKKLIPVKMDLAEIQNKIMVY
jgi:hypothetical protein